MKTRANRVYKILNECSKLVVCIECANSKENNEAYEKIKELTDLDVEIAKHREKRSLNANGYMWVLLDKMATALHNNTTKEDLYRSYISKYGKFDFVNIQDRAVGSFIRGWESNGLGWVAEEFRDSTVPSCKVIVVYYGSSTYDTERMSRLIEAIVNDAKEMGIETKTPLEIADMMSLWKSKESKE